ncbi:MAG: hypothetical protein HC879_08860 [Leptolyngbyaceae cyanobacterium SL_5_9]|nr:hypothetical protein [Leptolyngbyaceae cyanobacterium SL_5_9]NJO72829.1 hypothetical protein [Leptolyngbyaceae cyanobacterium RM1_406_9]
MKPYFTWMPLTHYSGKFILANSFWQIHSGKFILANSFAMVFAHNP